MFPGCLEKRREREGIHSDVDSQGLSQGERLKREARQGGSQESSTPNTSGQPGTTTLNSYAFPWGT